ncbi:hypothetical protein JCM8202_000991 [Rhodotorula sphaerocarpa]
MASNHSLTDTTSKCKDALPGRDVVVLDPDHPPRLDDFHFSWKGPFLYLLFVVFCNVVIPCVIFYPTAVYTKISDAELIGIGSAALGVSSCVDAPIRLWRLTRHRDKYGPLYYPFVPDPAFEPAGTSRLMKRMPRSWWHLDFMMHTYTVALFFFALPLAIAPAIPLFSFFLFSFPMLVAPVGIIFVLTLKTWQDLPFWLSSDPPRTPTKPAAYYALEDTGAVDFQHGREWRKRCQARYAASPPFRDLMWWQTVLWSVGMAVFIGAVAAIDWTTTLNVAFGLCVSLIFIWAILWGLLSYAHVHWALKRERAWWRTNYATLVVPNLVRRPEDDRGEAGTERLGAAQGAGVKGPGKTGPGKTSRHRGSSIHTDLRLPTNSGFPPSSTWSTSAPDQVAPVTRTTVGRVSEDRELERARIPDAADDGDDGRGSASTTTIVGGRRSSAETTYSSGKDGAVSPSKAKAGAPSADLEAAPAEADPVEQNGRIV